MTPEPAPETPPACEPTIEDASDGASLVSAGEADLSEFSQRLASFGLGEAPDPLLTEARRPPANRRSSN